MAIPIKNLLIHFLFGNITTKKIDPSRTIRPEKCKSAAIIRPKKCNLQNKTLIISQLYKREISTVNHQS
jgi:hypothetical protein